MSLHSTVGYAASERPYSIVSDTTGNETLLPDFTDSPQWRLEETTWPSLDAGRYSGTSGHLSGSTLRQHDAATYRSSSEYVPCLTSTEEERDHHTDQAQRKRTFKHFIGINAAEKQNSYRSSNDGTHQSRSANRKIFYTKAYITIKNLWLLEVASLIISLICFLAIAVVLRFYDGIDVHSWHHRITLNTTIALLAVVGGAALAGPLSASIGQAKWLWFKKRSRPLSHFQSFENASRGALGSALMLLQGRGGLSAGLCAVLTIFVLAVNPFVQQVISLDNRQVNMTDGAANIPIASQYIGYVPSTTLLNSSMQSAIYEGILALDNRSFVPTPICSTGNCTWPSYETLSICSTCQNVTHLLLSSTSQEAPEYQDYMLPNGFRLDQSPASMLDSWTSYNMSTAMKPLAFDNEGSVLSNIQLIYSIMPSTVEAFECILQVCVNAYTGGEVNGQFTETPQREPWTNTSNAWLPDNPCATGQDIAGQGNCNQQDWYFSVPDRKDDFIFDGLTVDRLMDFLGTSFTTTYTGNYATNPGFKAFQHPVLEQRFFDVLSGSTSPNGSFPSLLSYVAQSMSLAVRTTNGESYTGSAASTYTVYRVIWPWLIFPFALIVLASAMLAFVAVETRNAGLQPWKNSMIASFSHGPDDRCRDRLMVEGHGLYEAERVAAELEVRLERGPGTWILASVA